MSALKSNRVSYTYHQVIAGHETDFLLRPNVVVEVDGPVHDRPDVQKKDLAINDMLERIGYRVVRVPNGSVDSFNGADSTAKFLKRMVAEASRNSRRNQSGRY
jgi:very-short-patch-repair endonuclease